MRALYPLLLNSGMPLGGPSLLDVADGRLTDHDALLFADHTRMIRPNWNQLKSFGKCTCETAWRPNIPWQVPLVQDEEQFDSQSRGL